MQIFYKTIFYLETLREINFLTYSPCYEYTYCESRCYFLNFISFINYNILTTQSISDVSMPKYSRHNSDTSSVSLVPEIAREFLPSPSRIPIMKWQEILEAENKSYIIASICEEIVQSAADTFCEGYFRRTAYSFIIGCTYEAWMRAFRVIQKRYTTCSISTVYTTYRRIINGSIKTSTESSYKSNKDI